MTDPTVSGALVRIARWATKALETGPPPFGERDKRKDMWFTQFWDPIYRAVCSLPYSEYNTTVASLEALARQVVADRGLDFAPDWFARQKRLVIPEDKYLARRQELGCAAPKKFPLVLLAAGGIVIAGVTVLATLALTKGR